MKFDIKYVLRKRRERKQREQKEEDSRIKDFANGLKTNLEGEIEKGNLFAESNYYSACAVVKDVDLFYFTNIKKIRENLIQEFPDWKVSVKERYSSPILMYNEINVSISQKRK